MPVAGAAALQYFGRTLEEFRKNRVLADATEPVPRVGRVGFHPVDDAVPVTALSGCYVLGNSMALI